MAEKTLRENFFDSLQKGAKWDVGVSINRTNPLPLDQYSVFKSESDLDTYIKGAFAYPGQLVAVVEEEGTAIYYLTQNKIEVKDETGAVTETKYELIKEEVGSMPAVDDSSIEVVTDAVTGEETLTLVGFDNAKAGASLVKGTDGKISWVDISGGFTTDITDVKTKTGDLNKVVFGNVEGNKDKDGNAKYDLNTYLENDNSLIDQVNNLKAKFNEMGGVFNFAGSFTSAEFANEKAENYDIGDVVLVDTKDEYLCVEKNVVTTTYKPTEDDSIIEGKEYFTKVADKNEYVKITDFGEVTVPSLAGYYEVDQVITKVEKYWEQFGDPDGVEALKGTVEGHTTQITGLSTKVSGLETAVGAKAQPESTEGAGDAKPATGLYAYADEVATNKAIAAKMEAEADAAAALKVVSDKVDKNTGDITTLNTNVALKAD